MHEYPSDSKKKGQRNVPTHTGEKSSEGEGSGVRSELMKPSPTVPVRERDKSSPTR